MDNAFILGLRENEVDKIMQAHWWTRLMGRVLPPCIRFFNRHNSILKLSFGFDAWNEFYDIRKSYRYKEHMLKGYMTSIEQAINIYHCLVQTIVMEVPGDVVELGCYEGNTAILLRQTLDSYGSHKALHVYDSFEGLPEPSPYDRTWKKGMLTTTQDRLIENFKKHNAQMPAVHPGWFKDTLPTELPEQISFAHLDGDFYASILESLNFVYPRLSKNAVVVVDDYCDPAILDLNNVLPGVKKACDEFLADKPEKMVVMIAGPECHAFFRKE